jgi:ABC-2 type transport system ATP-binding protein
MRRPLSVLTSAAVAVLALGSTLAGPSTAASTDAAPPYSVQTLHFKVAVGPDAKVCDIVGDLYTPTAASSSNRMPAILTTNGFGGSKDDQAGIGRAFAQRGYVVLSYSGLGFGGSDCKITLDDPDWDGVAGRQLVSYLGGASGIAFTDDTHTTAAPALDVVKLDAPGDPRVGMVGGSYGGEIQFAVASVDPRVDTIVPIITWNDLSYSLGPNNTGQTTGVTTSPPGATKLTWGLGFSALGVVDGVQNAQTDPSRLLLCPNFADFVCVALVTAATLGYFDPGSEQSLRHASVASYLDRIHVPTLLLQGQHDTLFNLNEAAATYQALKARGVTVRMIWQSWGHSVSTPAPGEIDLANLDPVTQYETGRVASWFDHFLKDMPTNLGPPFAYFRDWISYTGNAAPAYAGAGSFPVGTAKKYYLSGSNLAGSSLGRTKASQTFHTAPAGVPVNLSAIDAISYFSQLPKIEYDVPGTTAQWNTAPLAQKVDVVGSPKLTLQVSSLTAAVTQALGPAGQLVLFTRLQDVAPDGTATDIRGLTAPVRIADVTKPFTVTMPGIVYRFAPGHRIRLVVSASSVNYRGGLTANVVTIPTGTAGQVLSLPAVP